MIAVPVTLIIPNQQNARFVFIAVAILVSCYLTVGLIFIPKVGQSTALLPPGHCPAAVGPLLVLPLLGNL